MAYDPNQSADKLILMTAAVEGYKGRTVRFNGKYAAMTATYNYSQDEATKNEICRRVAALWNLAHGLSTEQLEALDRAGHKLLKTK